MSNVEDRRAKDPAFDAVMTLIESVGLDSAKVSGVTLDWNVHGALTAHFKVVGNRNESFRSVDWGGALQNATVVINVVRMPRPDDTEPEQNPDVARRVLGALVRFLPWR